MKTRLNIQIWKILVEKNVDAISSVKCTEYLPETGSSICLEEKYHQKYQPPKLTILIWLILLDSIKTVRLM